jgi:hypothetical protein
VASLTMFILPQGTKNCRIKKEKLPITLHYRLDGLIVEYAHWNICKIDVFHKV